ncbi:MAG: 2-amino-4-hydroxy-6-hydroxymethyldihydropteridine diphosphokinase [Oscillospiraceae bacterium]|nr:2-amino-4-hydroxy-6-hydroxymethyldihydropteridine diphosphokinase [Oscillospiraceae bacterium]
MDKIIISDLEIFCNHGVLKEENILGQKFLICAELFLDIRPAGRTDNLELSVNYADVCHTIKILLEQNTFKLIETAAERTADELLLKYSLLKKVSIEIKKPWAPILLPLKYVSVSVERSWHTAYLSIGSNIGDKEKYLSAAIAALSDNKQCRVEKVSEFIITEPVGPVRQDDFLNACIRLSTLLSPYELLALCHDTENSAGRVRTVRWGPRTLDLDIIFYDDEIICDDELIIPHPEMTKRDFVLKPLEQIAPYAVHPVEHCTVSQLRSGLLTENNI